jgi:hypothetical protein
MEDIGCPFARVVELSADAQEKIVRGINPLTISGCEPVFSHEMRRRERAFLEKRDPKQVLVIAQTSATALHVWFLEIHAIAKLLVPPCLVLHASADVLFLVTEDAVTAKLRTKPLEKFRVSGEMPRLEHRGFRQHIAVGLNDCFAHGTGRVTNLKANVPQNVKDPLDDVSNRLRDFA